MVDGPQRWAAALAQYDAAAAAAERGADPEGVTGWATIRSLYI